MTFDADVRLAVYRHIVETARGPSAAEIAAVLDVPEKRVQAAFRRLHDQHLLVPEPEDPRRIRIALPFSGVETPFRVLTGGKAFYANCAWDAFGVAAALDQDTVIETSDGHTGEPLSLEVRGGSPLPHPAIAHFAVPAAHWWDDIVHT